MRYVLYILDITGQTLLDIGVLACKMNSVMVVVATTEICRNVDRMFENFIIINIRLCISNNI